MTKMVQHRSKPTKCSSKRHYTTGVSTVCCGATGLGEERWTHLSSKVNMRRMLGVQTTPAKLSPLACAPAFFFSSVRALCRCCTGALPSRSYSPSMSSCTHTCTQDVISQHNKLTRSDLGTTHNNSLPCQPTMSPKRQHPQMDTTESYSSC